MAVLGLLCCMGFSLGVTSRGYSLVAAHRLLIAVVSLMQSMGSRECGLQWLRHLGSVFVALGI